MQLHLLSSPGEPFLGDILEIARSILRSRPDPTVAYLPAADIQRHWIRETKAIFRDLAKISAIKVETHPLSRIRATLDQASMLYIPGGNTYLLAQRLHRFALLDEIKTYLLAGLPLIAFSAGTVLCGQDILTTNDINCCGCTTFAGLGLVPFNFNVHYPVTDGAERDDRDERLQEYLAFNDRVVLALEDGAYLRVTDQDTALVRGNAWKLERSKPRVKIEVGAENTER